MFKKLTLSAAMVLGLAGGAFAAGGAHTHVEDYSFPFESPFGAYDQNQLQRGLKVYTQVCASCHGLKYVSFRNLADEGGPSFSDDQMRAYADQFEIYDADLDDYRPARPSDRFPDSMDPNAPDLSLMAKARAGFHGPYGTGLSQLFRGMGGPEYIASLMAGYVEAPDCAPEDFDGYYNVAFAPGGYPEECKGEHGEHLYPGSWISMPPPLYGEDVDYDDGHDNSLHHEAQDVAAFLMWTAEPQMNARKHAGLVGVIFLTILAVLLYFTNKRLWSPIKHRRKDD